MEWQPIETAPKDGTEVLVYGDGQGMSVAWWETKYIWVRPGAWVSDFGRSDTHTHEPSHWMPLPPPPGE